MIRLFGIPRIFLNSPTMATTHRFRPSIIGFNSWKPRSRHTGNLRSNFPENLIFHLIFRLDRPPPSLLTKTHFDLHNMMCQFIPWHTSELFPYSILLKESSYPVYSARGIWKKIWRFKIWYTGSNPGNAPGHFLLPALWDADRSPYRGIDRWVAVREHGKRGFVSRLGCICGKHALYGVKIDIYLHLPCFYI